MHSIAAIAYLQDTSVDGIVWETEIIHVKYFDRPARTSRPYNASTVDHNGDIHGVIILTPTSQRQRTSILHPFHPFLFNM